MPKLLLACLISSWPPEVLLGNLKFWKQVPRVRSHKFRTELVAKMFLYYLKSSSGGKTHCVKL